MGVAVGLTEEAILTCMTTGRSTPTQVEMVEAADAGDAPLLASLIDAGGPPDAVDADGISALFSAAMAGHQGCVDVLLKAGADPNLAPDDGFAPLHIAAEHGYAEIVAALLHAEARVDARRDATTELAFTSAAAEGHLDVLDLLLASGADPNAIDREGTTALLWAQISAGQAVDDTTAWLLENGASADHPRANGERPLHRAVSQPSYLAMCVELGPGTGDAERIWQAYERATMRLLEAGADPHRPDSYGTTPLHSAAAAGNVWAIHELLRRGAGPNVRDSGGATPLVVAVMSGQRRAVRVLLEGGADASLESEWGTAMQIARRDQDVALVTLLG